MLSLDASLLGAAFVVNANVESLIEEDPVREGLGLGPRLVLEKAGVRFTKAKRRVRGG